jgi:SulP family sulfate permease
MILSLLRVVHHTYHPHTGVMVANNIGTWDLIPVSPVAVTEPGFVIYRFGAELFYANANRFAEEVTCLVGGAPSPVRWLVADAEAITRMDYSSSRVLAELLRSLKDRGVRFGLARVPWGLKADLARHHVTESIDPSMVFNRLHDAMDAFEKLPSH